jgi:[ribosomal protein S18]-alanine N-acetyltransferase
MVADLDFPVSFTTDPGDFNICANIMSGTDPWITLEMSYSLCRKAFEGIFREVYIIRSGKDIAGFVIVQVSGTFAGYIQTLCISESFRGKGLGTKLLLFCEDRIHKFSPNIFICVSSFNERAIKLYYKFGFKYIGELDNFVREGFSELLLRKTIGPRIGYQNLEKK